jgi:hypothetical protein
MKVYLTHIYTLANNENCWILGLLILSISQTSEHTRASIMLYCVCVSYNTQESYHRLSSQFFPITLAIYIVLAMSFALYKGFSFNIPSEPLLLATTWGLIVHTQENFL